MFPPWVVNCCADCCAASLQVDCEWCGALPAGGRELLLHLEGGGVGGEGVLSLPVFEIEENHGLHGN